MKTLRFFSLLLLMSTLFHTSCLAQAKNSQAQANTQTKEVTMSDTHTSSVTVTVTMQTNKGTIVLALDSEKAPETVANFISYAEAGHYDGTIFHRVISNFMIQGGGFEPDMTQKSTREPIKNEAANGLKNELGAIAMARTSDPHSATAQFFINTKDNAFLNHTAPSGQQWGYAVFGKVTEGLDVVKAIESVKTGNRMGYSDVPVEDVIIEKVSVAQ
jgi:peptidyl-prolyl cis-trans isomerase B (cyclophilin B)